MTNDLLTKRLPPLPPGGAGKDDAKIAAANFEAGLARFREQNGPSRLCEAVRPGERAMERKIEE